MKKHDFRRRRRNKYEVVTNMIEQIWCKSSCECVFKKCEVAFENLVLISIDILVDICMHLHHIIDIGTYVYFCWYVCFKNMNHHFKQQCISNTILQKKNLTKQNWFQTIGRNVAGLPNISLTNRDSFSKSKQTNLNESLSILLIP